MALGLRAIALLMLFYALIAVASRIPRPVAAGSAARFVVRSMLRFAPGCAIAYLIMIASWPWAALDLFNPIRALFAFAHFHYPIKTLLAGTTYMMAEVPRWYVPTYLAIKLPLFVWFGATLGILFALSSASRAPARNADRRPDRVIAGAVRGDLARPGIQRDAALHVRSAAARGAGRDRFRFGCWPLSKPGTAPSGSRR